eukprot:3180209-Alexandrium_andersonii.AAC.1
MKALGVKHHTPVSRAAPLVSLPETTVAGERRAMHGALCCRGALPMATLADGPAGRWPAAPCELDHWQHAAVAVRSEVQASACWQAFLGSGRRPSW